MPAAKSADIADAAEVANAARTDDTAGLGNRPERLEWLQDAGFGVFVHWSMDSQLGCVISHTLVGASEDYQRRFYEELPQTFNPMRWAPDEMAALVKLAGARYMVFTTKHHSGFCMWDTATTDFNIMNTPFGRDIVAEYVQAMRAAGLGVGFYYSPEDWWYQRSVGLPIRRLALDEDGKGVPYCSTLSGEVLRGYQDHVRAQCTELMTKFGPIDLIFFDGGLNEPAKETCWQLQPNILVTRGAIPTPEQTVPGVPFPGAWESCLTMGTQWHYKPTNEEYKDGTRLIEILIETRAKGGAMLLNLGPKPDGTVPEPQEGRFREVALWHFANGEAIHDTRPWIVTNEGPIWFTRRRDEDTVYAFITGESEWPRGQRRGFTLGSVSATEETEVSVLGHGGVICEYMPTKDPTPCWSEDEAGLQLSIVRAQRLYNNSRWPNPMVVKLTHVKSALQPPVVQTLDVTQAPQQFVGELTEMGDSESLQLGFEFQRYAGFVEELYSKGWQRTDLQTCTAPGEFRANLPDLEPGRYQVRAVVVHPRLTRHGDHVRFSA
ncbi:MAG: alpha-L-fucosidase [Lentisphaerae bacterium]|jgi:alpha-L-fucosidase|nr:alpha-L-fucosidase [Lentisphaerota bacterium]MBT4819775.1 alpha-L-fucosidase [Lentisphaerota bacterium]MBT5612150.1 alpha-L-fucosidase [Lentisphaerota bacterium]MBT7058751.1 alpha-L-fucosidase [Lentisphaerota bacterium]